MKTKSTSIRHLRAYLIGLFIVILFLGIQLNSIDFSRIVIALLNSLLLVFLTLFFTSILSIFSLFLREKFPQTMNLFISTIKSVPQIIALMIFYILLNILIQSHKFSNELQQMLFMAFALSLVIFSDPYEFLCARVDHFKSCGFYFPLLTLGVNQWKIIFNEILWKNSRSLIFLKLLSILGITFFLQTTIDFIISIGLSYDLNNINLISNLGNLLALVGSKQDLLALGYIIFNPLQIGTLFTTHLFGLSVAFLISFTLVSFYKISISVGKELNEV